MAALHAAADEFHQLFVRGRSGQESDSAGILAGVLLLSGIRKAQNSVIKGKRCMEKQVPLRSAVLLHR